MRSSVNLPLQPTSDPNAGPSKLDFKRPTQARNIAGLSKSSVKLARSSGELQTAQRLRYRVFIRGLGATADVPAHTERCDVAAIGNVADHLIVVDDRRVNVNYAVVGTYRRVREEARATSLSFYSAGAFNFDRLLRLNAKRLESGRPCVLREYRQRPILQLLRKTLALNVAEPRIAIMFACASFHAIDPAVIEQELSHLHPHPHHLARPVLPPHAIGPELVTANRFSERQIEPARVSKRAPPLMRGYLHRRAKVGLDAHRETSFKAVDVCVVRATADLAVKYVRHGERECGIDCQASADGSRAHQPVRVRQDG